MTVYGSRMGKTWIVGMALVAAACGGGGGDDCERFFDKTKPIFEKAAKERGKSISDADKAKFVEKCRAAKKEGKTGDDEMMKCVLAASGDAAVAACMEGPFGDYMKKSKKTEAQLQLNKLGKSAKVHFEIESTFPIGKSNPPTGSCCEGPNHKCAVDAAAWAADPVWSKLDFQIDEPHLFQYSYESTDGKTFVARAVGDLDCDMNMITYELRGQAEGGMPSVTLTEPPPNSD